MSRDYQKCYFGAMDTIFGIEEELLTGGEEKVDKALGLIRKWFADYQIQHCIKCGATGSEECDCSPEERFHHDGESIIPVVRIQVIGKE